VHANAETRRLTTIDATCPLVTKVHVEAKKFAAEGYTIVLIGHEGHEEVEGTMGEAPEAFVLVETEEDVDRLELPDPDRVAFLTQTTLSVDETAGIVDVLRARFPRLVAPPREDICYATTNRQEAVKRLARLVDVLLVIGSPNSSNSNRLVEVGVAADVQSHLIDDASQIDERWLDGAASVGVTSGASAPERLVQQVCAWFRERGVTDIRAVGVNTEDVVFRLPAEVRPAAPSAA
jgi:4-hydroxy-3-methylbut-2-enyl diphosphate reductase